ncbi:MAG: hypothetical protein QW561_00490 [Candidatus Aenigmatarchaeota archaeon]
MKGQKLLSYLDKIYEEASVAQRDKRDKYEQYTNYYKGLIWPKGRPAHKVNIVINYLKEVITRKVAMMTDVVPSIDVLPSDERLFGAAEVLKKVIIALWEEYSWSDTMQELLFYDQLYGSAFTNTCWSQEADWGMGDIAIVVGDPRFYLVDPFVMRANQIHEAEYIIYEYFKPTSLLRMNYPDRADEIKPTLEVADEKKGFIWNLMRVLRLRTEAAFKPAIERSLVKEYWIKDRETKDENGKLLYPTGRFIKRVGDVILDDEPNPYWDGRFPIDMMDWQFDPDSPFGISEVEDLSPPYRYLNHMLALVIENALLSVSSIWTGDIDSLPPGELEKLLSNKPMQFIGHRPGKPIVRQAPPPLPAHQIQSLDFLKGAIDELSGMAEIVRGKRGGVVSAQAIESLALLSQSLIRYQAKRLETMLSRIGQKLIARILQFYTEDRIFYLIGEDEKYYQFKYYRDDIIAPLKEVYQNDLSRIPPEDVPSYLAKRAFKDFQFKIIAGSSLALTKVQKATLAMTLFRLGIIDDEAVLDILEFPNKKAILERKRTGRGEALPPRTKVKVPQMKTDRGMPTRGLLRLD